MRIHGFATANIFQFRFAQLAVGGLAQVFEFFSLEFAHLAGFNIEHQWTVPDPANFLDVVADLLKHLAQFAVAAFDDDNFVPGIVTLPDLANLRRGSLHTARAWLAAIDSDT